MATAIVILALVCGGLIYVIAKQRGQRKAAMETMDRESEMDRKDAEENLDNQRNDNAWDNLNDTINLKGK